MDVSTIEWPVPPKEAPSLRKRGRTFRTLLTAAATLGLVACTAVVTGSTALAAAPGSAFPAMAKTRTQYVTLVTGDRVAVTTTASGRDVLAVRPASRAAGDGAFASFQDASGDRYVIPASAEPYAGRQLDLSLFDVTALVKDPSAADRVPVTVSFTAGTRPTAPTGLTLTTTTPAPAGAPAGQGASAHGYATATSGRKLARLLKQRIGADVEAGRKPGTTPLFQGVASVGRTGAAHTTASAGTSADSLRSGTSNGYKLNILTLNVEDRSGAGATGTVLLTNTDDATTFTAALPVVDGVEKVAVPDGHYSAAIPVPTYDAAGDVTAQSLVTLTDFTVSGATTEDLDARTATASLTAGTPRPADADFISANWARTDATGQVALEYAPTVWATTADGTPVYVNAQPAAAVGAVGYTEQWSGHAPDATGSYRYDLDSAAADNVPADQRIHVTTGQLAAVTQRYDRDPASPADGQVASNELTSNTPAMWSAVATQTMPARLTDYLSTFNGGDWLQESFTGGLVFIGERTVQSGDNYSVAWAHGPLALGLGQYPDTIPAGICEACVADGDLLALLETTDSDPGHTGGSSAYADTHPVDQASLYRDGTLVDSEDGPGVYAEGQDAPGARYRLVADQDSSAETSVSQSTSSHTELTFGLPSAADTESLLPDKLSCAGQSDSTPCLVLPLLTAHYDLATDGTGTSHCTEQSMGVEIGHVTYQGAGSRAAITSATVQVSFDAGQTWHNATVTGSVGHYQAHWTNPAAARGTNPSIRVTAADAAGDTLSQTVLHAYTVAATTS
ncbi:hypothetical protein AQJ54_40330 [Streptomyces griseorubiginosus]|uniref:Uncharacterized protein n=2 Tax=Streptomyces griseorubiginosus TaxID=67304 RepID=A0A101RP95_9ACTN|nr:hypothetical protein AQJ54_40330 [Streptomyces griseorubiginosus]